MNECGNITIIEGNNDPNLTERGEVSLQNGQVEVSVTFGTPKASSVYRFEYLYVDAFGVINPGNVPPVVVTQTQYGFTVELAAAPLDGYVLRWRVDVISISEVSNVDAPESFRVQLPTYSPPGTPPIPPLPPQFFTLTVTFQNPRSNTLYGFSELRVENLVDDPAVQTPIAFQVCAKTQSGFTIVFTPLPPTENYYLVGRTP